MPTDNIVALLIAERDRLNRAIEALKGPGQQRGRSAGNGTAGAQSEANKPQRQISAASRRKMAAAQKRRWAAWRASKTK